MPQPSANCFTDADCARDYLEQVRWPKGAICPGCAAKEAQKLTPAVSSKTHARKGLYQCRACRRQFSVTVGTLLEDAHTPLHKWLLAIYLMCSRKEGISAVQLQRDLSLGGYRTAWLMCHRVRWALQKNPMSALVKGVGQAYPLSSRKPLRIPLPWDQAVRGLLEVAQEPRDKIKSDRKVGAKMERR